jgi:HAMP domain-containing protein
MLQAIFREVPSFATALAMLVIIGAGFLWLATRVVDRREYVLEQ